MIQYECEVCKDIGFTFGKEGDYTVAKDCLCKVKKKTQQMLRESGISEEFQQKGFTDFDDMGIEQLIRAKEKAKAYYQSYLENEKKRHNSIIFCGQVGAGKTHLGAAICNNLLNVCHVGITYMAYRNVITVLKQIVTDKDKYYKLISPYYDARLLYIDDLLKGKTTDSDLNILYEIINHRYMNNKPMVISTEKSPEELIDFDEAVGSRILEMCRGNIIPLRGRELNYRLYSQGGNL